ncbi:jg6330 [Pararge aegeria aegeria]|uniref:Jg6330 protein n=1 Tax=Pararge aegeria aegeria TaxID=348720 RepID=A0A8S4RU97_9NEOP|nr:jg6330 [Pararge aegeria aegeria]
MKSQGRIVLVRPFLMKEKESREISRAKLFNAAKLNELKSDNDFTCYPTKAEFESKYTFNFSKLCALQISLASTVKENIVRKPACLRVIHNVLKGVWSPPIRTGPVLVDYGLNPFSLWNPSK